MLTLHFIAARHPLHGGWTLLGVGGLVQLRATAALYRKAIPGLCVVGGALWWRTEVGEC